VKQLQEILSDIRTIQIIGNSNRIVNQIEFDSRRIKQNDLFVAVRGVQVDGRLFMEAAIKNGATVIVCETKPEEVKDSVTYIVVPDSAEALGMLASAFYDHPSRKLKLVGVTGTNGKTTVATLLYELHRKLGYAVGLLSTVENRIDNTIISATHTTPDAVQINSLLSKMVDSGCDYCFMEVSSHAVDQKRIAGLQFSGGIFTNISHDHLDYHKTFKNYLNAKKTFFDLLPKEAFALSNIDDRNGNFIMQNTKAQKYGYSLQNMADFKCRILESQFGAMLLNINEEDVWIHLTGRFNAYNVTAIYGGSICLGHDKLEVLQAISALKPVVGRFETLRFQGITAIVDYAHTPDALKNVLESINGIRTYNENLITVVGCGGNRDKEKRPVMASVVCELSDKVILTSDNPRSENPETILDDMMQGVSPEYFKKVLRITDRREAIKVAAALAHEGDIVLVAGKGHENYQEINGIKYPFDDKEELQKAFLTK
jgi:UDP-N-acetylmuramoyl-L-alanyl-D-glutamate--2,6-diaminopimelate ligase